MGKHKEWRKIAKRERRRKLRVETAQKRELIYNDEEYLKETLLIEQMMLEQIDKINAEENEKWLIAERRANEQWQILQARKRLFEQEQFEKEARIKLEWELEQKRLKEETERLKKIEEENKLKQERLMKSLEEFLSGDVVEPPEELLVVRESRPGAVACPFFTKTGCCRFGDQCSRNHQYPGISTVLLATNFYVHFGLNNSTQNEYDTDILLEYEDSETLNEYNEFFYDVLAEFEKFGKIIQFKVCNNHEKHLRGNMYVEFSAARGAVAAHRALHSRWYAGRQLSLQFCTIASWKNAICGLQLKKRCPKGRACNFLHVFTNPNDLFSCYQKIHPSSERRTPTRSWRWSESPEIEIPRKSKKDSKSKKEDRKRDGRREHKHKRSSKRDSRRSSERRS